MPSSENLHELQRRFRSLRDAEEEGREALLGEVRSLSEDARRELRPFVDTVALLSRYVVRMDELVGEALGTVMDRLTPASDASRTEPEPLFNEVRKPLPAGPDEGPGPLFAPLPGDRLWEAIHRGEGVQGVFDFGDGPAVDVRPVAVPADMHAPAGAPHGNAEDAALDGWGPGQLRRLNDVLLGEILVRFHVIDEESVGLALLLGEEKGIYFGEALLELGLVTSEDVEAALAYQEQCREMVVELERGEDFPEAIDVYGALDEKPGPLPAPRGVGDAEREAPLAQEEEPDAPVEGGDLRLISDLMLGRLMVLNGMITEAELEEALEVQRASGMRLGETLVFQGVLTWNQVQMGLDLQRVCGRERDESPAADA